MCLRLQTSTVLSIRTQMVLRIGGRRMSDCCCSTCDARMIELIQAIDDLRRSLVIVQQESRIRRDDSDQYYWEHG